MIARMKLLNPLFHLFLTLSSAALATEFHAGEQLNENNFQALTKDGLVLIEMYSPFCAVCKRFAPSWIELVGKMTPYQSKGLSMAQVDCSAQGDLCAQLGVNSYPTLKLYQDGKDVGNYDDDKNVDSIQTYLEQKVEEYQSTSKTNPNAPRYTEPQHSTPSPETYASDEPVPQASPPPDSEDPTLQPIPDTPVDTPVELPNPFGQVISLNNNNWNSYTDSSKNPFPIFVHLFAVDSLNISLSFDASYFGFSLVCGKLMLVAFIDFVFLVTLPGAKSVAGFPTFGRMLHVCCKIR